MRRSSTIPARRRRSSIARSSSSRCAAGANASAERADLIVTPSAAILPPETPSRKIARLEWGADTERFRPGVAGQAPFARPAATVAVFAGAFRSWHGAINLVRRVRELRARGPDRHRRGVHRRRPGAAARAGRSRGSSRASSSPARCRTTQMPAYLAAADIGVAPFDIGAHRRCRSASTGRRSRSSSTWPQACPSSRRPSIGFRRSSATAARACSTTPRNPARSPTRSPLLAAPEVRRTLGSGRARARGEGLQLGGALPALDAAIRRLG